MVTFLFAVLLAILGFLCFSGPDGVIDPRHRNRNGDRDVSMPQRGINRRN
jgi:hypothetical protein